MKRLSIGLLGVCRENNICVEVINLLDCSVKKMVSKNAFNIAIYLKMKAVVKGDNIVFVI